MNTACSTEVSLVVCELELAGVELLSYPGKLSTSPCSGGNMGLGHGDG